MIVFLIGDVPICVFLTRVYFLPHIQIHIHMLTGINTVPAFYGTPDFNLGEYKLNKYSLLHMMRKLKSGVIFIIKV